MPLFAWANGGTPAQVRQQAGTDMDMLMDTDNWLIVVCPRGTFCAQGARRLVAARALNAAAWFMSRVLDPAAQQLLREYRLFDPAFLSQLMRVVMDELPTQSVASVWRWPCRFGSPRSRRRPTRT